MAKGEFKSMSKKEWLAHENEICDVIRKHKIAFFDYVFAYYAKMGKTKAYHHKLNESKAVKEALEESRVKAKSFLVNKWIASEQPTLQIAAFKLMCNDEERAKLNQNNVDITSKGDKIKPEPLVVEVISSAAQIHKEEEDV